MDAIRPTRLINRIETLDVLRGFAICGILLMNIPDMGLTGWTGRPALPALPDADWIAWGVQRLLFEGSMRGLFTMLFGAGMLLMLRRAEGEQAQVAPVDVWTRRCLALGVLGIVNFLVLLWPGEILWNYGLTGLVLLAFRTARPRTLIAASLACVAALTTMNAVNGIHTATQLRAGSAAAAAQAAHKPLTDDQKKAVEALAHLRETMHPPAKTVAKERDQRSHWPSVVQWSWTQWSDYNFAKIGWLGVLESLGFMLMGMALFRTGVLTGQASSKVYVGLAAFGYAGGLALRGFNLWSGAQTGFDPSVVTGPVALSVFRSADYEAGRLLMTLGHLGLLVLLFRAGALGRAAPLRALGRMALTTYMAQSVVTSVIFYGFGLVGRIGFAGLMAIAVCIWIATGAFCMAWLRRHEQGPVEALLRAVAYDTFRPGWPRRRAAEALAVTPSI